MQQSRQWQSWIGIGSLLTCLAGAPAAQAQAVPVAANNACAAVSGMPNLTYLFTSTVWTGQTWMLNYTLITPPAYGTLTFPGAPGSTYVCIYTATNGYVGSDSFVWRAADGTNVSNVATCSVTVVANVVTASSCTNSASSGVLTNFSVASCVSVPSGSPTLLIQGQPANGTASVGGSAYTLNYCSTAGFVGTDTFAWAATDGMATSATVQATMVVSPAPPVPTNFTIVVASNTPIVFVPSYTGGSGFTCWPVSVTSPSKGSLTTNGIWRYTPSTNFVGADAFKWMVAYSNATQSGNSATVTCSVVVKAASTNADWTQWRFDECRTAQTPMNLPNQLYLQWRRDMPASSGTFDGYYSLPTACHVDDCRPVQLGKQLFVSLMANDSVTAYNTDTGAQQWRYYATGALRRPPLAMALAGGIKVVIFGSDDGYVYCLNAVDGSERWRFRAAPKNWKAMGYGRLSSVWPIWASPVAYNGNVYVVAGHMPSWGLFMYCLDATSGVVLWNNDNQTLLGKCSSSGFGPLAFSTDHQRIFGTVLGKGYPWAVSANTGKMYGYTGTTAGLWGKYLSAVAGWYIDGSGNNALSEPIGLTAGAQTITLATVATLPGFTGTVGSLLAGDHKLFVSTTGGSLYCYGGSNMAATIYTNTVTTLPVTTDVWTTVVQTLLSNRPDLGQGLALVVGIGSGRLVTELAQQATNLMIVAVDPDTNKLYNLRVAMDAAGWSGARVSTVRGSLMDSGFAPYQAALIVSEDLNGAGYPSPGAGQNSLGVAMVQMLYQCTRPFGGEIWLPTLDAQDTAIDNWLTAANLPTCNNQVSYQTFRPIFSGLSADGFTRIKRTGFPDSLQFAKPPFRPAVFGVTHGYQQANTIDPYPPDATYTGFVHSNATRGVKSGYDLYSWLPVTATDPTSYEPPAPANNNTNVNRVLLDGLQQNPLYARPEPTPNLYFSSYCPQNCNYGSLITSGGKDFYSFMDSSAYEGVTVLPDSGGCQGGLSSSISGDGIHICSAEPRCSCASNMGLIQMGLVPANDPTAENWVNYSLDGSTHPIQENTILRVGVNFGVPGDRYDMATKLRWTHHPALSLWGGNLSQANPLLPITYRGTPSVAYHSSLLLSATNAARGWLSPSQVIGMSGLTIPLVQPVVATRGTPNLPLDGLLNDSCWTNQQGRIALAIPGGFAAVHTNSCLDTSYAMLRYDATNLYVAGGAVVTDATVPFTGANTNVYIKIAFNNRDLSVSPVMLYCGVSTVAFKTSLGIDSNAWQAAFTVSTTQDVFRVETAIPWAALAAAGLWTSQMVMNVEICGAILDGHSGWTLTDWNGIAGGYLPLSTLSSNYSPVYLDAPRGPVTVTNAHTVQLYFTEMEGLTNGQRVFDVKLQGNTVLSSFDVAAAAGGPKTEVVQTFSNVLFSDHLDIDFVPHAGAPILNSVAIVNTDTNPAAANIPPVALLRLSVTNGPAPLAVSLNAQNSYDPDGQIVECAWETGDGRLARGSLVSHVFAEPGTYQVNLLVLDNRGATAVTSATVTVSAGLPAAFICNIRSNNASGCDYTNLAIWGAALAGDVASTITVFRVSSTGTWVAADNNRGVTFSGGRTGQLLWVAAPLTTQMLAAVRNVSGTGTVAAGTVTIPYNAHTFAISDTGMSLQALLFTVDNYGAYVATNDDNQTVTFTGGALGTLKHINHSSIAYIANCCGAIQVGTVTCANGHTFSISSTGSPVYTVVAQCYNDWPNGLNGTSTLPAWGTDANHCLSIRPAAGQGHSGRPKNANGTFSGFALNGALTTTAAAYTRIAAIIVNNNTITLGTGGSINRVLGNVTAGGDNVIIANSIGSLLRANGRVNCLYNCTFGSLQLSSSFANRVRAVNCLAYASSNAFNSTDGTGEFWLSHSISVDATATNCDAWQDGNEKNQASPGVSFACVASNDYHLAVSDGCARGQGQPGLGADIDGELRTGPWYDVGADQNNAPLTFALTVVKAGNGKSSLTNGSYVSVSVPAGATTQVVYTANEWYRINAFVANGIPVDTAAGLPVFTQAIANISGNVSNMVSYAMATPLQTGYTNVPTSWLTNWPSALVQSNLDAYSIQAKYLLGLDPTVSNTYSLSMDKLYVSGSNVIAEVKRNVTGALAADGMHGLLILQGATTPWDSGFTNILSTAVTGATVFDGTGHRAFTNAVDGSARYYRAIITGAP